MSNLAPKLKHRIQIQTPEQVPNADNAGFDISYVTVLTVWAAMDEISDYVKYIRAEAITDKSPTHYFTIRKSAVQNMGRQLSGAFGTDFKEMSDIIKLKSDYFIFLQQGSTTRGRLFQILTIKQDENHNEYVKFRAMEIEEHGTGGNE